MSPHARQTCYYSELLNVEKSVQFLNISEWQRRAWMKSLNDQDNFFCQKQVLLKARKEAKMQCNINHSLNWKTKTHQKHRPKDVHSIQSESFSLKEKGMFIFAKLFLGDLTLKKVSKFRTVCNVTICIVIYQTLKEKRIIFHLKAWKYN